MDWISSLDAEQVSTWAGIVIAALLGLAGLVQAHRAHREATELARQADERAAQGHAIDLETRDVRWQISFADHDGNALRHAHRGSTVAHEVQVVVWADEKPHSAFASVLEPGEHIDIDLAGTRADFLAANGGGGILGFSTSITWRSPAGMPEVWNYMQPTHRMGPRI